MEGYNNKPEMLFVLRMNAEGNDVFIEEYELSEFPKLEEWFNKPKGIFDYNAIFEEMKLVGQCLGAERIVNYDRRKFVLELELKDIKPERAVEPDEIAKYTTLDTLVAVLQSGKMRMNSIVSMNDKTEIGFLEEYIRNYKEDFDEECDKYLFADKEFITSFTTRIDDLDMWRLYGDNARGVCMVFERINKDSDELFNISYIAEKSDVLEKIAKLQDALKDNSIRFRMNLLKKYQHFLKLSDYSSESECRLMVNSKKTDGWFINRDNGILTPYIEKKLVREVEEDNIYPFRLSGIILGPASRELTANMMQILYMAAQCQYSLFVKQSKITSYR